MSIIVVEKEGDTGAIVPSGGAILYQGTADPGSGWGFETDMQGKYVEGADTGGADNTARGSASHSHGNPTATGIEAGHTHSITGLGTTGGPTGSFSYYWNGVDDGNVATYNHTHDGENMTSDSQGSHSHGLSDTDAETAHPPYHRLYWIKATEDAPVPIGGIILWNGALGNAPEGFVICNGANGTPDLRDKFVYGASADGEVGNTGGAETHTHGNSDAGADGAHSHSATGSTSGAATEPKGYVGGGDSGPPGHDHPQSATLSDDTDHTHTIGDTGSGSSLPPYCMLYFLQRIS